MNEISSVEKRVNFHFQSSKGNMRSDSGQQSNPNAGGREEYYEKEAKVTAVEDQVATQWSEDGPSEDVLFGERSGSYSTTSGRITSVTLATVQALDTVQEAVSVAEIARFSYCPCSKSKPDYRMQSD